MEKKKIDWIKVISLGGTVLGIASTLIAGWCQNQSMERTIEEKVNEALNNR